MSIHFRLVATVGALAFGFGITGCGSDSPPPAAETPEVSQTLDIVATEYAFTAESATITTGETVQLNLTNEGELDHELQVLDPDARVLGRIDRLPPGGSGSVVVTFDERGVYTVVCDIDDHLSRGQSATFPVE